MGRLEEYEVMKLLGKGSFGSVYCVRRLNDRSMHVMKKISIHNMPQKERIATEQECKVLQRLRHPGIVCYEDSFIHKNRQLCIVMTLCEGGDLSSVIEKRKMRLFPEQEVVSWFLQISLALQYMHEEHILHRDLKTQNIFLTKQGVIKLGDFGIAKVLEGTLEMAKTVIGTPYYMSPELFRNQPYSYKSDIWSLGCVLYEMVGLRHAFEARDMNSLVQKILRANFAPIPSTASKDVRALIKNMLSLSPGGRPSVNDVLALPFIRKEMGSYIQNQLGDDSAANLLKEDPKLIHFIQQEQNHLEQQARKLGFDVKKRSSLDDVPYERADQQQQHNAPQQQQQQQQLPKANPLAVPTLQDVEKDRVQGEMREKERQKRAQAFLERELRAKERAEQALKLLQKEKHDRLKALQEQRDMRQKRMSNVHPRGEAGLMNDWQKRLQQAQVQHEERRKQMGMVPGDHRPKPPPKSKLEDRSQQQRNHSVLEQRNHDARSGEKRPKNEPAANDKENVKNIFDKHSQQQHREHEQQLREKEQNAQECEKQLLRAQQEEDRRKAEAEAAAAQKRLENEKVREEMKRDMHLMEAKLKQLKAKKDQDDARKKAKSAAQYVENNKAAAAALASAALLHRDAQHQHQPQHPESARPKPGAPSGVTAFKRDPPVRYADSHTPDSHAPLPRRTPPLDIRARRTPPSDARASVDSGVAGRMAQGMRPAGINVDVLRVSEPHYAPPLFAPPSHPPPHRLQVLPSPMAGVGYGGVEEDLFGEGLGADLISRQKELDRLQARRLVKNDTDRELKEFQMTLHRINQAVNGAGGSRPMMLPAEVGAKISERDRLLREKQQRDAHLKRGYQGRQGALRGFNDVALEGALFSPTRGPSQFGGGVGAHFDDAATMDDEIEDELLAKKAANRLLSPPQEVDEQMMQYDRQEEELENELAHRTLKIQMLKTAVFGS